MASWSRGGRNEKNCSPIVPRIILLIASGNSVPKHLVREIEEQIPGIRVKRVSHPKDACAKFENRVSLILVDANMLADFESDAPKLELAHPTALRAVLIDESRMSTASVISAVSCAEIHGVLPMNLKLDAWLLVVKLMLQGVPYFPKSIFQAMRPPSDDATTPSVTASSIQFEQSTLLGLTEREYQVLELAARGFQNKVVAWNLRLSEQTVKVHIHRILKKLGVHNRTEAAALFHGPQGKRFTPDVRNGEMSPPPAAKLIRLNGQLQTEATTH